MKESHWKRLLLGVLSFLYPSEHIVVDIAKGVAIGLITVGIGLYVVVILLSGGDNATTSNATTSMADEQSSLTGEILPTYFFSYGMSSSTENCPQTKGIDWELAIIAMSDYWQYGAGSTSGASINQEPAAIQQSFNLHCERNMAIYNDMIELNPHLLKRENKTEYP